MARKNRRQRRRPGRPASLNLVSLMDIFTILVFFLMVNSSDVEVLDSTSDIKLPDSSAEQLPDNRINIMVSGESLMVQGRALANVADVLAEETPHIEALAVELRHQRERQVALRGDDYTGKVTVLGDRQIPYRLLKRVLYTCQQNDFTEIALAVNQRSEDEA